MRLQEVYFICKTAIDGWVSFHEVKTDVKTSSGEYVLDIDNFDDIERILDLLSPIAPFNEDIQKIKSKFNRHGVRATDFAVSVFNAIRRDYTELFKKVSAVCDIFSFLNIQTSEYGFDVRLPDGISLGELSKCAKDLETVLSKCPFLAKSDSKVEFLSVDVGSTWLSFCVYGISASIFLAMLGSIVDKAIMIRSHILTCREQEATLRRLNLGNDILESQIKINKAMVEKLYEETSRNLNQMYMDDGCDTNEANEYTKHCLKTLCEWMDKGMEIYSSVETSSDIKAVFPPVEAQKLTEAETKLLVDHFEHE